MSHLPPATVEVLTAFVQELDGRVQADLHSVDRARRQHEAFRRNYLVMDNLRALVCYHAGQAADVIVGVEVEELGSGGWEAVITADGQRHTFRWKKAELDQYGRLVVTTNSDSFLSKRIVTKSQQRSLFDVDEPSVEEPVTDEHGNEVWVLAYLINHPLLTFRKILAAWPSGFRNDKAPFKLILEDQLEIDLGSFTPPAFPKSDDDLFADEDDERGEGLGGA